MRPAGCCWSATAVAVAIAAQRGTGRRRIRRRRALDDAAEFWTELEASGPHPRVRSAARGLGRARATRRCRVPRWLLDEPQAWAGIPLIHHRAAGRHRRARRARIPPRSSTGRISTCCAPPATRPRARLPKRSSQEALANAQRFEEFNRRFAFILHDIKNLVSQLSLLARNAERHADNPEFRADMVATLKSSVGKMNDLLARLAPHSPARVQRHRAAAAAADPDRSDRRQARATATSACSATRACGRWSTRPRSSRRSATSPERARREQRRAGDRPRQPATTAASRSPSPTRASAWTATSSATGCSSRSPRPSPAASASARSRRAR